MTSKVEQSRKLLAIKKIRRQMREVAQHRANRAHMMAQQAVIDAEEQLAEAIEQSGQKRLQRLQTIFDAHTDHATLQTEAVMTYFETAEDIAQKGHTYQTAQMVAEQAAMGVKMAQNDLARALLQEARAENLVTRIADMDP